MQKITSSSTKRPNEASGESANNAGVNITPRKSFKRSFGEGQQHASTSLHTASKLRKMATREPANFADPEKGSTHLISEYKPCTKEEAASGTLDRPIRVYADGIYDLFHAGHARQLQQCKKLFPNVYLLVGCCSDQLTHSRKGKTVNNEWERYENLSHCRYVDEIVKDAPWTLSPEFLEKHRIDFVAHDEAPYSLGADAAEDIYAWLKKDGKFCATQRTEGVSTSDLITRIIKNYDMYIRRQLKRGYNPKELNINKVKATEIKTKMVIENAKEKTNQLLREWKQKSGHYVRAFLERIYGAHRMEPIEMPQSDNDDSHLDDDAPVSPGSAWSPGRWFGGAKSEDEEEPEKKNDSKN